MTSSAQSIRARRARPSAARTSALIVLLVGFALTAVMVAAAASSEQLRRQNEFERRAGLLRDDIQTEVASASEALHALRSGFVLQSQLSRGAFEAFAASLGATERTPGLVVLQHASAVEPDGLEQLVAAVREDPSLPVGRRQSFTVQQPTPSGVHVVVDAIHPFERNSAAWGLDLRGLTQRREAIDAARASGRVVVSAPISLLQSPNAPGFLLVLPLYLDPESGARGFGQPGEQFSGVVAAVFRVDQLFEDRLREASGIEVELYDVGEVTRTSVPQPASVTRPSAPAARPGSLVVEDPADAAPEPEATVGTVLYDGDPDRSLLDVGDGQPSAVYDLEVGGRRWRLVAAASPAFDAGNRVFPFVVGLAGGVASLLGAGFVRAIGRSRESRREAVLQSFLEFAPDAIVLVDQRGRIVQVNRQTEALFGYQRADLLDQPVDVLVPDELRGAHGSHVDRFVTEPSARPMGAGRELLGRRSDGSTFAVDVSLSPIATEEGTVYAAAVRDVTERREAQRALEDAAEQLRAANKLKDQFLDITAHELRTPLTAIDGFAEVLRTDAELLDGPQRERIVARIGANVREMREMVERLLDLSRLNAGRVELQLRPASLKSEVDRIVDHLQERMQQHRVAVDIGGDLRVQVDRAGLRHILVNLLVNAVKFSEPATTVTISAQRTGDDVEVHVTDEGPGIAAEEQPGLFEHFVQGSAQAPGARGAGVGLSIVRRYVELHGGQVGVRSQLGHGATFWFTLPAADDQ